MADVCLAARQLAAVAERSADLEPGVPALVDSLSADLPAQTAEAPCKPGAVLSAEQSCVGQSAADVHAVTLPEDAGLLEVAHSLQSAAAAVPAEQQQAEQ